MNKTEKIIAAVFIAGIAVFLVISIFILLGKSGNKTTTEIPDNGIRPTMKVLITPYPTIPPITDFTMQVNERRWYPDTVNITSGHAVTIINIGPSDVVIKQVGSTDPSLDFGTLKNSEDKTVAFDNPGVYKYVRNVHPEQVLTINVK